MALSFTRLHPTIGAEVYGLDASAPVPGDAIAPLVDALAEYGVLVFRSQRLDDAGLVAFGRTFGGLEILPEPDKREAAFPEIFNLTNVRADGKLVEFDEEQSVFLRGTYRWHTDSSFRAVPCLASMLYAVEVPNESQTQFANMYQAYESLSDEHRARLDRLQVMHSYEYSRANNPGKMAPMDEAERTQVPPVEHPLVREHPSGRRSLYLGGHASHVVGLPEDEGREMLRNLLDKATVPKFVYPHNWDSGDLVVWDNRCTLHRVRPYELTKVRRVMRRITVEGTEAPRPVPPA